MPSCLGDINTVKSLKSWDGFVAFAILHATRMVCRSGLGMDASLIFLNDAKQHWYFIRSKLSR